MSREFLDEFENAEYVGPSRILRKPKNQFGRKAGIYITQCVAKQYRDYCDSIPADGPQSAEECATQFFADRQHLLRKAMNGEDMKDDDSFRSYVWTSVQSWFKNLDAKTEYGKVQDALRKRLERDARFTTVFDKDGKGIDRNSVPKKKTHKAKKEAAPWGLVGGPGNPSTVPLTWLKNVAFRYEITIDTSKADDPDRKRNLNYGKTGQLNDMLFGVLQEANGTLDIKTLLEIAQYRVAVMRTTTLTSLDAPAPGSEDEDGRPVEYASADMPVDEQVFNDAMQGNAREKTLYILEQLNGHESDQRWVRRYIKQHPDIQAMLMDMGIDPTKREASK